MPLGFEKPHSWLRDDDDFDRYNKPGSSDWFSLSGDVSFKKPNNRHDALKVESLLGYGGYMDIDKSGGPLGLSMGTLEKPIKAFQAKNGLEVDGWLKPGGPTIKKMKELYGGVFGGTPAPTPAMMDAHVEKRDAGEDGFLHDEAPKFGVKPNRRLDAKAHLMEYERWNRDWARGSGDDPKGLAPEYEQYIRDLDKDHGHDPGLIFARDLTQQVEKYHGKGGELAKQFVTLLADRPDLQREYLGGPVPTSPPIGTFKPGGEEGVKAWIDQDRVANGLKPRYAIPISTNTRNTAPAAQDTPDPKNLLEYGPNFGLPEDEGLRQAAAHDAERARQAAQSQPHPIPAEWPEGMPPTAEDWALWYDPARPPPPLPPQDPADVARYRKPEFKREVPEYWPQGLPPTAEDWGLHQNPPHAPDLPNPRPPRPGDGYPTEPGYRPDPPPPSHVPGFADEMPHPSQGLGPPRPAARIDAQVADEIPVVSEDDPRVDRPILPEVIDLTKLDDDTFEEVAAKAGADRNRLEGAIRDEHQKAARHREAFGKALQNAGVEIKDAALEGAALDPILDAAWDAIKNGRVKIDPTDLGKSAARGFVGGIAIEGVLLTGELVYHANSARYARDRAKANEDARDAHDQWESDIAAERRERGRIRSDQ